MPANTIVRRILRGKPSAKALSAGATRVEEAEAGVGEEQHDDERTGDLQRREEHLAEGVQVDLAVGTEVDAAADRQGVEAAERPASTNW